MQGNTIDMDWKHNAAFAPYLQAVGFTNPVKEYKGRSEANHWVFGGAQPSQPSQNNYPTPSQQVRPPAPATAQPVDMQAVDPFSILGQGPDPFKLLGNQDLNNTPLMDQTVKAGKDAQAAISQPIPQPDNTAYTAPIEAAKQATDPIMANIMNQALADRQAQIDAANAPNMGTGIQDFFTNALNTGSAGIIDNQLKDPSGLGAQAGAFAGPLLGILGAAALAPETGGASLAIPAAYAGIDAAGNTAREQYRTQGSVYNPLAVGVSGVGNAALGFLGPLAKGASPLMRAGVNAAAQGAGNAAIDYASQAAEQGTFAPQLDMQRLGLNAAIGAGLGAGHGLIHKTPQAPVVEPKLLPSSDITNPARLLTGGFDPVTGPSLPQLPSGLITDPARLLTGEVQAQMHPGGEIPMGGQGVPQLPSSDIVANNRLLTTGGDVFTPATEKVIQRPTGMSIPQQIRAVKKLQAAGEYQGPTQGVWKKGLGHTEELFTRPDRPTSQVTPDAAPPPPVAPVEGAYNFKPSAAGVAPEHVGAEAPSPQPTKLMEALTKKDAAKEEARLKNQFFYHPDELRVVSQGGKSTIEFVPTTTDPIVAGKLDELRLAYTKLAADPKAQVKSLKAEFNAARQEILNGVSPNVDSPSIEVGSESTQIPQGNRMYDPNIRGTIRGVGNVVGSLQEVQQLYPDLVQKYDPNMVQGLAKAMDQNRFLDPTIGQSVDMSYRGNSTSRILDKTFTPMDFVVSDTKGLGVHGVNFQGHAVTHYLDAHSQGSGVMGDITVNQPGSARFDYDPNNTKRAAKVHSDVAQSKAYAVGSLKDLVPEGHPAKPSLTKMANIIDRAGGRLGVDELDKLSNEVSRMERNGSFDDVKDAVSKALGVSC